MFALNIDVVKSTKVGGKLPSRQRFLYQKAIVDIVNRFSETLDFSDCQRKFTGDGWIIFSSSNEDIEKLVVLGKLICHHYPDEVSELLKNYPEAPNAVRACISSGQDFMIEIFQDDGSETKDWIGDSARRATSYAGCAGENELLIDFTVHSKVKQDFETRFVDVSALPSNRQPKHPEDGYSVWSVGSLVEALEPGPDDVAYAVLLQWTGQHDRAQEFVRQAAAAVPRSESPDSMSELVAHAQSKADKRDEEVDALRQLVRVAADSEIRSELLDRLQNLGAAPDIYFFNRMINIAPDYRGSVEWYDEMRAAGISPNEVTFSTLINIAPDYAKAKHWYDEMRAAGVLPNEVTFSTLINIAPDYAKAKHWFDEMRSAGVPPNAVTFNTLINIAPDYAKAKHWYDEMRAAGVPQNAVTFNTLINIAPDYPQAEHWYDEMRSAGVSPDQFTFSTLINIAPDYPQAEDWFREMRAAGVSPNEITFSTLIKIAPDYAKAKHWYDEMRKARVEPNEVTTVTLASRCPSFAEAKRLTERLRKDGAFRGQGFYAAVFSKVDGSEPPLDVIEWYFSQDYRHPPSIEPVIRMYEANGLHPQAMEFVVRWPQLPAAGRFMAKKPAEFAKEIERFLADPELRPSALYAQGLFLYRFGEFEGAKRSLTACLDFGMSDGRRKHITSLLEKIGSSMSM